ncbi:leucyl/phenylalanyl-tRNA--protein transferase [Acetivibrio mesophilus]|uniref:Leucyl/phenylalanyl-tRNA--protein transferase n=1 Tax=Acetivibrio mesophilus TaxID=2487273 RepID=A0A4Q0I6R9_9FIRM|nr:leucyl/phenylalanyl-tRNA--protein transferase [Acetivibrio mesophilus]ODM25004.1 leucyl/phenylalanyl-tRNA--protein transferase [Clostridium sp. Bc-iso-3]RXE59998.1 leucyl/phenylalanyl-tRNA--protein transferase [Acetivibrio mesophilus]
MPVFRLSKELIFPHPSLANEDGILAVGGDLSCERLLLAYRNGIFPWFTEDDPILWWSPDPRCVLFPKDIKISKSMKKFLRKQLYEVTFDTCFKDVITMCAELRRDNTWITSDIIDSYCKLHNLGFAHSIETWHEGALVGGLYGVSLGKCFFGESMFSVMENASKTALITLSQKLEEKDFLLIDCQVHSKHLESLGAVNIDRDKFLKYLERGLAHKTLRGNWEVFNLDIDSQ